MLHNLVHITVSLLCDAWGQEAPCINAYYLVCLLKGIDLVHMYC